MALQTSECCREASFLDGLIIGELLLGVGGSLIEKRCCRRHDFTLACRLEVWFKYVAWPSKDACE